MTSGHGSSIRSSDPVARAKAGLLEFGVRADEEAKRPLRKHLVWLGAGLTVASVVGARSKSLGRLRSIGLRALPLILKFL